MYFGESDSVGDTGELIAIFRSIKYNKLYIESDREVADVISAPIEHS